MATVIRMPALSDTMTEGVLVAWHKNIGDTVKSGDLLAEIETDKAVMEFESFFNGTLLHRMEAGQSIKVDAVIAVIGAPGEDWQAAINGGAAAPAAAAKVETPAVAVVETLLAPLANNAANSEDGRSKASPLAKAMAKDAGIDLSSVKGSGDDGRIVKRDVEAALAGGTASKTTAPAAVEAVHATTAASSIDYSQFKADGDYEDVAVNQMRKTIARRLGESKFSAPEFYLTMEVVMDECMRVRTMLNESSPVKLSFNDFVVKATSMALRKHPAINSSWLGDKIRYYNYVNMGVAVAVEDGLLVPVIRNSDTKSLSQIATEVKEYAGKAKDRKLTPSDMSGNTFTISNLGMFGIEEFTAIINPPDSCILAVGGINEKLVMRNGEVKVTNVMKLTLTCDHRTVDGASGAKFLQTLKDMLESPMKMLV